MSDFGNICQHIENQVDQVGQAIMQFPWKDAHCYGQWLLQQFFLVQHTTRFLALSAARYSLKDQHWHTTALHHLREETGHDQLLVKDLVAMDIDSKEHNPLPETLFLFQSQYYWTVMDPVAHLGYAYLLEGVAALYGAHIWHEAEACFGSKATNFIRVHNEEDQAHYRDGLKALEGLEAPRLAQLKTNLYQSQYMYGKMLEACQTPVELSAAA